MCLMFVNGHSDWYPLNHWSHPALRINGVQDSCLGDGEEEHSKKGQAHGRIVGALWFLTLLSLPWFGPLPRHTFDIDLIKQFCPSSWAHVFLADECKTFVKSFPQSQLSGVSNYEKDAGSSFHGPCTWIRHRRQVFYPHTAHGMRRKTKYFRGLKRFIHNNKKAVYTLEIILYFFFFQTANNKLLKFPGFGCM